MASYALARAAYGDLEEIDQSTLTTWGASKRGAYIRALFARFDDVAELPSQGRARPELGVAVRSLAHERHVIFYESEAERCFIPSGRAFDASGDSGLFLPSWSGRWRRPDGAGCAKAIALPRPYG